jgi:thiamine kinase-like enzyme
VSGPWATDELRAELEEALRLRLGADTRIAGFDRRRSGYRTSFPIEELDVRLASGEALELVFKDLSREALEGHAQDAKPDFMHDPLREIEVYERLLPAAGVETALSFGAVADEERGRYCLFLERVSGVELYQVGRRETWEHVARWLARAHDRLHDHTDRSGRLLRYDAALLGLWPRRAAEYAGSAEDHAALSRIADRYDEVVERILALSPTVIHGEFYASNVLVDHPAAPDRVCPVDWEVAAVGAGLIDLAALVSGRWSAEDRTAMALAYREASPAESGRTQTEFEQSLDACRLHVALQWLGWSDRWSPPPEHASDWLQDALTLSRKLGI